LRLKPGKFLSSAWEVAQQRPRGDCQEGLRGDATLEFRLVLGR